MKAKDLWLLSFFRANARKPLTRISRETHIPVSTLFDKLKGYEKEIILKHTALIDFRKLGFEIRVGFLIKAIKGKRQEIENFLKKHYRINNLFRITNGYDYFVEAYFKDIDELQIFNDNLEEIGIEDKKDLFIVEEVKREAFLSYPDLVDITIKGLKDVEISTKN